MQHYLINKKEKEHMSCILCNRQDIVKTIFTHLPQRVIRHSERVSELAGVIAGYIPDDQIPEGLGRECYRSAIICGAYYHDIGIYLAGNDIERRPAAAEKLLNDNWHKNFFSPYKTVVLETVRYCREQYGSNGYPDSITGENIPLHAAICGIADDFDMIMSSGILLNRKEKSAVNFICQNNGSLFHPDAVACFEQAQEENYSLYLNIRGLAQSRK